MTHRDDDIRPAFGDQTPVAIPRDLLARAIADFRTSEALEHQAIAVRSELEAVLAAPSVPIIWVRVHPDGTISNDTPLWDETIEETRKRSGAWIPLGCIAAAPAAPLAAQQDTVEADFFAGICVSLQVITAADLGTLWAELVRACDIDKLLQYAAHIEPDEWELAGFAKYARSELGKRKPAKRATVAAPHAADSATPHTSQIKRAMDLLDSFLGDTDPVLRDGITQAEIEEEYPVMAAMQILSGIYTSAAPAGKCDCGATCRDDGASKCRYAPADQAGVREALSNDQLDEFTKERFGNMHSMYRDGFRRLLRDAIKADRALRAAPAVTAAAAGEAQPIQRFNIRAGLVNPEQNGMYVRYDDHIRASPAPAGARKCRACNGNDGDIPCAYPEGHSNCLRNEVAAPAGTEKLTDWQPIETAPKTGRTLLLGYLNRLGKWRTVHGQWMSEAYIESQWAEPDGAEPGWYETSVEADDAPNCWPTTPSHWMPLPAAPALAARTDGEAS